MISRIKGAMKQVFILGLTGQSGAGKGEVSKILAENYGYAVIDADRFARQVVTEGSECLRELADAFGSHILRPDGQLDRKKLAESAFKDRASTDKLNRIIHPYITGAIKAEIENLSKRFEKIVLDAPTLFESGSDKLCDEVLAVLASYETRKARIISRDSLTEQQLELRMSAQQDDDFFRQRTKFVIYNDFGYDNLFKQVNNIISAIEKRWSLG